LIGQKVGLVDYGRGQSRPRTYFGALGALLEAGSSTDAAASVHRFAGAAMGLRYAVWYDVQRQSVCDSSARAGVLAASV